MKQKKYSTSSGKCQGPQRGKMFLVMLPTDPAQEPYTWDVDPGTDLVPVIRQLLGDVPVLCKSDVFPSYLVAYAEKKSIFGRLNTYATCLVGHPVDGLAVVVQSGRKLKPWSKYAAKRVIRQIMGGDDDV